MLEFLKSRVAELEAYRTTALAELNGRVEEAKWSLAQAIKEQAEQESKQCDEAAPEESEVTINPNEATE